MQEGMTCGQLHTPTYQVCCMYRQQGTNLLVCNDQSVLIIIMIAYRHQRYIQCGLCTCTMYIVQDVISIVWKIVYLHATCIQYSMGLCTPCTGIIYKIVYIYHVYSMYQCIDIIYIMYIGLCTCTMYSIRLYIQCRRLCTCTPYVGVYQGIVYSSSLYGGCLYYSISVMGIKSNTAAIATNHCSYLCSRLGGYCTYPVIFITNNSDPQPVCSTQCNEVKNMFVYVDSQSIV